MATQSESKTAVIAAIIGNIAIAITKFVAAALTGSSAMISEGIHSLVDTGNGGLLLYGLKQAATPPDSIHPFGYGKALYFWTFVVSVSIFGIGGGMSVYEGISHIQHVIPGAEMASPTVNYIVLSIAALIEGWSLSVAIRGFKKAKGGNRTWRYIKSTKDPSTFAVVFEDTAAILGLIFAFLGIFLGHLLGNPYLDGVGSIMIGLLLMVVAGLLAYESRGLLLGEGVDAEQLADIRRRVESDSAVDRAAEILTLYMGPETLLINLGVVFKPDITANEMHGAIHRIEKDIQGKYPEAKRIYIETEYILRKKTA